MHLDASDYPGTGTTLADRTANGYDATLVGAIDYATTYGGVLSYNPSQITDYLQFDVTALNNLTSGTEWTIETVLRLDNTGGTTYFHSMATTANNNHYIVQKTTAVFPYNETRLSGSNFTFSAGETFVLTIVHTGTTQYFYKNGVFVHSYTGANDLKLTEGWTLNQEQDSVLGGFDGNQATDMGVYAVRLYNKPLTADEVAQNFNAVSNNYGL